MVMSYYLSNYSLLIVASDSQICSLMIMQQNAQSRMHSNFSSSSRSECTHTFTLSLSHSPSHYTSLFFLPHTDTHIHFSLTLTSSHTFTFSLTHMPMHAYTHTQELNMHGCKLDASDYSHRPQWSMLLQFMLKVNDLLWGVNKQMEMPAIFHNQSLTRKLWDTLFLL